jgi:hypothetical protein
MLVFLVLEASQPCGKTYRLGFGCNLHLAFDDSLNGSVVLNGLDAPATGRPFLFTVRYATAPVSGMLPTQTTESPGTDAASFPAILGVVRLYLIVNPIPVYRAVRLAVTLVFDVTGSRVGGVLVARRFALRPVQPFSLRGRVDDETDTDKHRSHSCQSLIAHLSFPHETGG